jgi:hypothetical protein
MGCSRFSLPLQESGSQLVAPMSEIRSHQPLKRTRQSSLKNEEWEAAKPEIERLYKIEKKSLKEVMRTMDQSGFHATYALFHHTPVISVDKGF